MASAAETWVTDIKSGCKIGYVSISSSTLVSANWNGPIVDGKAQGRGTFTFVIHGQDGTNPVAEGEGEMQAGLLDGKVILRWSNGDSYEGTCKKGLWNGKAVYKTTRGDSYDGEWLNNQPSGKGIYKWANGNRYEGDWLKGERNGQGILKDAEGKIIHDGQWKDGKPVVVGLKTDNVLGVPWGASEKTVENVMNQRPDTKSLGMSKRKEAIQCSFTTTFNGYPATAAIFLYQDQMYWTQVIFQHKTDIETLQQYDDFKQGLINRYGPPIEEKGIGLEALTRWALGEEHFLSLAIGKSQTGGAPPVSVVVLHYIYQPTDAIVEKAVKPEKTSDF
jgi:Uncharacterized protein conserved in bacteria